MEGIAKRIESGGKKEDGEEEDKMEIKIVCEGVAEEKFLKKNK